VIFHWPEELESFKFSDLKFLEMELKRLQSFLSTKFAQFIRFENRKIAAIMDETSRERWKSRKISTIIE
jgi:hypothetical protein